MRQAAQAAAGDGERAKVAEEQQATVEVGGFQVMFKIPGRVASAPARAPRASASRPPTIAPDLMVHAVPAMAETAFLQASFKHAEDAPLLPGRVSIYRDGVFVGRSPMAVAGKDETVRLGFGADEKVKIARTVLKRNEGSAGLIVRLEDRRTRVQDHHPQRPRFCDPGRDRGPASGQRERGDPVEMLPLTTPPTATDLRDSRGVMEWAFEAKPGEVKEIAFAWRVRWPKDKGVVMTPGG